MPLNRRVAAAMTTADDSPASILSDPLGPLWYRGLVTIDADAQAARAASSGDFGNILIPMNESKCATTTLLA